MIRRDLRYALLAAAVAIVAACGRAYVSGECVDGTRIDLMRESLDAAWQAEVFVKNLATLCESRGGIRARP